MINQAFWIVTALPLAVALTAGCAREDGPVTATQVAARVNGDEITVHQVNYFLARNRNVTPEVAARAKREILDGLIDRHLASQKAIDSRLDRSPNVVQAIEAAKSEILARAYLEQVVATLPEPAPWEIQKYYSEHPELFAQRRVFDLEEFAFVAKDDVAAGLRELSSRARSMQEVAEWLRSRGVNFVANHGARAAEQIALDILPRLQAMKEGRIQLFDAGGGRYQVIRVLAAKVEPVDEATATPRIKQFLVNRRSSEVIAKQMRQIKEQAKIEFVGEFAGGAAAPQEKIKAGVDDKAGPPAAPGASAEAEGRAGSEESSKERSRK